MSDVVKIFDTTLRDGEQSPGASMTVEEKVIIARQLEMLRVDVIEAGFAAASEGDFNAVAEVSKTVKQSIVCSLARALPNDITAAGEAVSFAKKNRIHTFIATSPIHMEKKLKMKPQDVIDAAVTAVNLALNYTDDVEFSAEDAVRSDLDFLIQIFEEVIKAGAKTLNVPDTVGYSMPLDWGKKIKMLIEKTKNSDTVVWSTHCHNDLGMAVAIDTTQILKSSRLISQVTGYQVQPNKAIVGANAFAHESGIHQDGVLKHRETYDIMTPQDVGWSANRIVLGKLSGRNAFKQRLEKLGLDISSDEDLNLLFQKFKELADRKTEIFDEDIQALVSGKEKATECYRLESLVQESKTGSKPKAEVVFFHFGEKIKGSGIGNGPVDATVKAIESRVKSNSQLLLFSVNSITNGTQAQGEVTMRLSSRGRVVNGVGSDPDIVVASAKAYLNALNRLESEPRINPQQP